MNQGTSLTARQKRLVEVITERGCTIREASEIAGYAVGESGRVHASKTLRKPHVQAYLRARLNDAIGHAAPAALYRIIDLTRHARSEYVQLEAAKDLLNRAGYRAEQIIMGQGVQITIDLSPPSEHGRVLNHAPEQWREVESLSHAQDAEKVA